MAKNKKQTSNNLKSIEYSLGDKIKYLRELRKLTQKELAAISNVSQATIAHIEKQSKDPSLDTLNKLAKALDIHAATFFTSNEVFVFDLKRLRRKYTHVDDLTPHLYMGLGKIIQYAKDIGML